MIIKYNLKWTIAVLLKNGDRDFIPLKYALTQKLKAYQNTLFGAQETDNPPKSKEGF